MTPDPFIKLVVVALVVLVVSLAIRNTRRQTR